MGSKTVTKDVNRSPGVYTTFCYRSLEDVLFILVVYCPPPAIQTSMEEKTNYINTIKRNPALCIFPKNLLTSSSNPGKYQTP